MDSSTKTLTVAGYGELDRKQWLDLKKQYCVMGREPELKKIVFSPNSNRQISFPSDSSQLFSPCARVEIDLPSRGIDTSAVTNMERMFGFARIANPDVSNWDTGNVTTMRRMFYHAERANPDVSKWDTSKVRDLSRMFEGTEVANPDVSRWNTEQVTSTERMFYNAVSADPDTSQWKLPNIDNIAWMFYGAVSVSYIDTTKWNLKRLRGPFDDPTFKKFQAAFRTFGKTTIRFEYKPFWDLDEFYMDNHGDKYGYTFFEFGGDDEVYSIYKEVDGKEVLAKVSWKSGNFAPGWDVWRLLRYLDPPNQPDDAIFVIRPKPFVAASANPIFINVGDPLPPLTYRTNPGSDRSKIQGELATTYKPGDPPGEYPITQGTLGLTPENASKYGFRFTPATVIVKGLRGNSPEPKVEETAWVDGAKDCNTRKVTQSRTVTTTPYRWDSGSRKWVLDTAKATKKTETRQRDMNDGEHKACSPQPPAQVNATNWVDGAKDCNTRKVTQSRTVTTTPYKWDSASRKWVPDTSGASQKTETRQRDMNDGEHRACTPQPPAQVTATNWVDGAKDCNTRKVTQSRTVTTTPHKWDSSSRKWVPDNAAATKKTETRQRDMNDGEHRVCTPQPNPQVTSTDWVDGAKDCNTRKVTQSRTVTTTPHKWDSGSRKWILDTSKASKKTESRQRDMNDGEHKACSPQPPAQVTATNWVDGAKDCNTRKVSQSRTVTTTPHKWDSGKRKWVLDTSKASQKTETRQRDMNDGEHKACSPQPPAQVTATNWV
ncbi:BspA family leucine-rich repeat surface protein, partial [Actinotignum sp. GS-2025e]|uniref:BspA family leucine-rich repeat surface protein n=1 Tax=Actinotignum sp. GS-2025e TaxID=3427278 RepID=UPI003F47BC18